MYKLLCKPLGLLCKLNLLLLLTTMFSDKNVLRTLLTVNAALLAMVLAVSATEEVVAQAHAKEVALLKADVTRYQWMTERLSEIQVGTVIESLNDTGYVVLPSNCITEVFTDACQVAFNGQVSK